MSNPSDKPIPYEAHTPYTAWMVNFTALIPRHWFIYVLMVIFPLMIFINIDNHPGSDDSGHYFNIWFMGSMFISFGLAMLSADILRKPMFFCMPRQQKIWRAVIFMASALISLLFYGVAVAPQYSFWSPDSVLGGLAPLPIGMMFSLIIVSLTLRFLGTMSWVLVLLSLATSMSVSVLFRGSGADIVRPPDEVFSILVFTSALVIPLIWWRLGRASLRRELIQGEPISNSWNSINRQLEGLNFYAPGPGNSSDFASTSLGQTLLAKISASSSTAASFWRIIYRFPGSIDPLKIAGVWLATTGFALFVSVKAHDTHTPIIFLNTLVFLTMLQGNMIGRRGARPIPQARQTLFTEWLFNGLLRYTLSFALMIVTYALSQAVLNLGANPFWEDWASTLIEQFASDMVFCLILAPLMLFIYHCSRSLIWLILIMILSWIALYNTPVMASVVMSLNTIVITLLMLVAWVPFVSLIKFRSFHHDLI